MSDRDAMGGRGEARDRGEAPRGAVEGRERRGSSSKGKAGKGGSGVERTTKKRRKVNHGMETRFPLVVVVFSWLRGQVVARLELVLHGGSLGFLGALPPMPLLAPRRPDGLLNPRVLVLLALFLGGGGGGGGEARGQRYSGLGRSGRTRLCAEGGREGGVPPQYIRSGPRVSEFGFERRC